MQYSQKNNFNFAINPYRFGAIAERFRPPYANNTNPENKSEFVLFFAKDFFGVKIPR